MGVGLGFFLRPDLAPLRPDVRPGPTPPYTAEGREVLLVELAKFFNTLRLGLGTHVWPKSEHATKEYCEAQDTPLSLPRNVRPPAAGATWQWAA